MTFLQKKLQDLLSLLIGSPKKFDLEHRLFNFMLFLSLIFVLIGMVANLTLEVNNVVIVVNILAIVVSVGLYYRGRVSAMFDRFTIWSFLVAACIILAGVYISNGGLNGPTLYFVIMYVVMFTIISPTDVQFPVFMIIAATIVTVMLTEYYFPEIIIPYPSRVLRFADNITFISLTAIVLYICVATFKKDLLKERSVILIQNQRLQDQQDQLELRKASLERAVSDALNRNELISSLLKELNHRIKNNLQVIMGLLSLHISKIQDVETRKPLEDSKMRLSAMLILHQRVYGEDSVMNVFMPVYLQELAQAVFAVGNHPLDYELKLNIDPVTLSIEKALPVGLIVNELLTNTIKHAFKLRNPHNQVSIFLHQQDDELILKVSDSGHWKTRNKKAKEGSVGLELVSLFTRQLKGELSIQKKPTEIVIRFPAHVIRKEVFTASQMTGVAQ